MLDCDEKKIIAIRAEVSFNLSQKDVNHKDIDFIRPNTCILLCLETKSFK